MEAPQRLAPCSPPSLRLITPLPYLAPSSPQTRGERLAFGLVQRLERERDPQCDARGERLALGIESRVGVCVCQLPGLLQRLVISLAAYRQ